MEIRFPSFKSGVYFQSYLLEYNKEIALLFKEVGNPKKITILTFLYTDVYSFSELLEKTGLQGSSLSNYLNSLIDAKLIRKVERGYYAITHKGIELLEIISHLFLKFQLDQENQQRYSGGVVQQHASQFLKGDNQLNDTITIKQLPPMLVAAIHSLVEEPENDGYEKIKKWATEKGIFNKHDYPLFGFDNNVENRHGYEFWIQVVPGIEPSGDIVIKKFEGGEYATLQCKGVSSLGKAWKALVSWREKMGYQVSEDDRYLEHHMNFASEGEDVEFELYLPIKKS